MNYLITLLCLTFISLTLNAKPKSTCQYKVSKNLCAITKFKNGISRKTDSVFDLSFQDINGKPINLDKDPQVKLWMVMKSGHGHGSEELKIKKVNSKYLVSNAWFLMLGEWQIKLDITYGSKTFNSIIPVCVGRTSETSSVGHCK